MKKQYSAIPRVSFDAIICAGGLDQITPTLSLKNGFAKFAMNYECGVTGGYRRIDGFERFDGHLSPADSSDLGKIIEVHVVLHVPTVGAAITVSGGASGVIASISGTKIGIVKITGTFAVGDVVASGGSDVGTVINVNAGPTTPYEQAVFRAACADIYRADIGAVPGSGKIRGVVYFNGVLYAFRNNAGVTAVDIYKSTSAGWVNVPLFKTVSFTAGTTLPADGSTLTQGGVTALVKRVAWTKGTWSGTAEGQLIITSVAGGNFSAGSATVGSSTVTLSGVETQLALPAGGKYEFDITNFYGQVDTQRIYGCNGVGTAFDFDGTTLTPIYTGATTDTPSHVVVHRNYLILAIGSDYMWSAPGRPYCFQSLDGAGTAAVGDTITSMIVMPGAQTYQGTMHTLGIFSNANTYILYGSSSANFSMVSYNTGVGARESTAENMTQTFVYDDSGIYSIQTANEYGNFDSNTLTSRLIPFVRSKIGMVTSSCLNRQKSQYRVFFNDGSGLYATVVNGKSLGVMPVFFPKKVNLTCSGKTSAGLEVNFFTTTDATDGYVYQFDRGNSFDGEDIEHFLMLNYANEKSPRVLKRFRKASVEFSSPSSVYLEINIGWSLGYDSYEYQQPMATEYTGYLSESRWDTSTWDEFFWDSSQGVGPIRIDMQGSAENIAMNFSGSSTYVDPYTLNSIVVHYTPRRTMR